MGIAANHTVDVAIIGGGMAGAALAVLLSQRVPSLSIALFEQHTLSVSDDEKLAVPSFDARSTALSYSTRNILEGMGLWSALAARVQTIMQVHVSERQRPLGMLMRAEDVSLPALGYVVENRHLGNVLLRAVQQQHAVHLWEKTAVETVKISAQGAELSVARDNYPAEKIFATLVVIADGAQSRLREQLGIAVDEQPYDQHALVANIVTELPHNGVAYERFTENGPVALLPLSDYENAHRAALIWTLPDKEVEAVMQLPDKFFLQRVQEQVGNRCGRLLSASARYCYPLTLVQAREQVRSHVVLMGSAAHHLHPVAGQGFNLIMRDCLVLAETLAKAVQQSVSVGALSVLQTYQQKQQWDQTKTVTASDWLPRLFSNRHTSHTLLRSAALFGLDFLPGMREWFAREATGL